MKMPMNIYATSDIVFKYLFGHRASTELLRNFVNAVQRHAGMPEFDSLEITNPMNDKTYLDEKITIIDIRAKEKSGRMVNVEVQVRSQAEYAERSLYYWAKSYAEQLPSRAEFLSLNPVVSISLLDFCLFPAELDWHSTFKIKSVDRPHINLTDDLIMHYIEMPKMSEDASGELADWIFALKHLHEKENEKMVLLERGHCLMELAARYTDFTKEQEARQAYLSREMFLHDQASYLGQARREGIKEGLEEGQKKGHKLGLKKGWTKGLAEGLAEGKAEGRAEGIAEGLAEGMAAGKAEGKEEGEHRKACEIARKLLTLGRSHDEVADITGLSLAELSSIQAG